MAQKHGKDTVVKVATADLSTYTDNSELNLTMDTHEATGYGSEDHTFGVGLGGGTFTMGGVYDSTASTGPRAKLKSVYEGKVAVAIIRQPEGTGSGLPQDSFNAILQAYKESNPVADMIRWTADFLITGAVDDAPQSP